MPYNYSILLSDFFQNNLFAFRIFVLNIYLCPPAFTSFRFFLSGISEQK